METEDNGDCPYCSGSGSNKCKLGTVERKLDMIILVAGLNILQKVLRSGTKVGSEHGQV